MTTRPSNRLRNPVSGYHPVKLLVRRYFGHFFTFFVGFAVCFAFSIFFRRWANLVAGFRVVCRWFFDMSDVPPSSILPAAVLG